MSVEPLTGANYPQWREKINMDIALFEIDKAITDKRPVEPTLLDILTDLGADAKAEREKQNSKLMSCYEIDKINWRGRIASALWWSKKGSQKAYGGVIPDCETAVEYLEKVESQFTGSSKAYVRSLIKKLVYEKYTDGGVRDHIFRMSNVAARLKPLDLAIKDGFLIYLIFNSLPKEFETFEVNYNSMNDKWTLEKFIAMCVQEEERIKRNNGGVDSVNMAKHHQKRKNFSPKKEDKRKDVSMSSDQPMDKDQCKWCKRRGHYQKNCIEFLKHLNKQGEYHVTFVYESLFLSYSRSTWWIDSGATIHVANSL
jgi:molybdopterin converting factor small subunit